MPKHIVKQIVQQSCTVCGKTQEWDVAPTVVLSPETIEQMQQWFQVSKFVLHEGQLVPMGEYVCSPACGNVLMVKLLIPPAEESTDEIDLAALRAANLQEAN